MSAPDDSPSELRVRDLLRLGELVAPRVCGEALAQVVGARGWKRPRFAKGLRMFLRCGVPDPWDPDSPDVPLDLQNVGIPDRRAVAPHAAPPRAAAPAGPALNPRIPMPSRPAPSEGGASSVAGLVGQTRRDDTADLRRKMQEKEGAWTGRPRAPVGGDSQRIAQPVKPMPMRPDMANPGAAPPGPAGRPVGTARPAVPAAPRMSVAPEPSRAAPVPRPAAFGAQPVRPEPGERVLPPRAAPPTGKISGPAPRSGGFRMAGSTARSSLGAEPEELPLDAPAPPASSVNVQDGPEEMPLDGAPAPVAKPAAAPPAVRPVRPGGLDDLFGMGAEPTTRIRIPKAEPRPDGEQKPRRPMVTDPATMVGGIDRRPPPPKPPVVKPSGTGGGGSNDMPDE